MSRQLSPRSSLAVLKQEAKRWLEALRATDASARERLQAAWPAAPEFPTLRDVQHALAREHGLRDWIALTAALDDLALDRQSHVERVAVVLRHGWDGDRVLARRIVARDEAVRQDSIHTAAACGDLAFVQALLARRPQLVTAADPVRGWTPLLHVAYGRLDDAHAVDMATLLLDAGASVHDRFDDGWGNPFTLITGAIGLGEGVKPSHAQAAALVELFLARGAEPFDTQALYNSSIAHDDITWTARLWDACAPDTRLARWTAVEGGLNGRLKVGTLDYLLGNAVENRHQRRAEWLLTHGARADARHAYSGERLHTHARLAGARDMVALLERHGAVPEALSGERALMAALQAGDDAAVDALVRATPALVASPVPLFGAASAGNARAIELLVRMGARVDVLDHEGASPLHRAAFSGSVAAVEALLAAGAVVDHRDPRWHSTPMGWASHLGRRAVAERLASVTRDVRALVRSARLERLAAVLREDATGATERVPVAEAPTALFCLPDDGDAATEAVQLLRAHGADVSVRDGQGRTAAQVARLRGLDDAAEALER